LALHKKLIEDSLESRANKKKNIRTLGPHLVRAARQRFRQFNKQQKNAVHLIVHDALFDSGIKPSAGKRILGGALSRTFFVYHV